jgi:hypothetical protein
MPCMQTMFEGEGNPRPVSAVGVGAKPFCGSSISDHRHRVASASEALRDVCPGWSQCFPARQIKNAMTSNPSPNHLHPRVEVDLGRLVLIVQGGGGPYEIDLERCHDPAWLLHFLLHVSRKTWCDRALAGEILAALDTACRSEFGREAAKVYCPSGRANQVDWDAATTTSLRAA